jgi:hypothetical protein
MTNPSNHAATNHTSFNGINVDWMNFSAQAMFDGGQAFLKTISGVAPDIDEAQLTQDENEVDQRYAQALGSARRARSNPNPFILSAVRNWSRKQAIAILREKIAGKAVRSDFYLPFQSDLQQQIATIILDLQQIWEQEDKKLAEEEKLQAAIKREEAEQAFGAAYPLIRGLNDAVLKGESERQKIFESGQEAARKWSGKLEDSLRKREEDLEARAKLIEQQERENREHQLALRSLATWDDKNSFVNAIANTGKNTFGCLLIWALLAAGILAAIYFAFPHH